MKVIGIAGSLRARSNTLHYIKTALEVLETEGIKTELISLRGKEIKPCTGCYDCVEKEKGVCSIKEDDFNEIFAAMQETDGLILGSPERNQFSLYTFGFKHLQSSFDIMQRVTSSSQTSCDSDDFH